jgi:hypothetical protein
MAQFMLLVRGGNEGLTGRTPEEYQRVLQQYFDWSDQLRRDGHHIRSDELKSGGRTVRVRDGRAVIDGPYVESKEGVGGYYMIEARDEDEAAELAKGCPVLGHGGLVEVREINVA